MTRDQVCPRPWLVACAISLAACAQPEPLEWQGLNQDSSSTLKSFTFTKSLLAPDVPLGSPNPSWAAVGDFDGDGADDIAFRTGEVLSDGSLSTWITPTSVSSVYDAGDVNGDGYDDVIHNRALYLGSSSGLATTSVWSLSKSIDGAASLDVNGDGRDDLWVGTINAGWHDFDLYLGTSSGLATSATASKGSDSGTIVGLSGIHIGDFDDDGDDEALFVGAWIQETYSGGGGGGSYSASGDTSYVLDGSGSSFTSSVETESTTGPKERDNQKVTSFVRGWQSGGGDAMWVRRDLLLRGSSSGSITYGACGTGACPSTGSSSAPYLLFSADLDGDGSYEHIGGTDESKGDMNAWDPYPSGTRSSLTGVRPMAALDIDGDGEDEILVLDHVDGHFAIVDTGTLTTIDGDGDGYTSTDCNDTEASAYPGATEITGDGIDQDCDGEEICFTDSDGDGARTTVTLTSTDEDCADAGEALASAPIDCDDTDSTRYPRATEIYGDEIDQDCNGKEVCYVDDDGDGARTYLLVVSSDTDCSDPGEAKASAEMDCDDADASIYPSAAEIPGDGVDQTCDGKELCYEDLDRDRHRTDTTVLTEDTDCSGSRVALASMPDGDCDDTVSSTNPSAAELPGDEVDQDCDGVELCYKDTDGDGARDPIGSVASLDLDCTDPGEARSGAPRDCDDSDASVFPGATEGIADGVDQDCDGGEVCFVDADGDGHRTTSTLVSADPDCADPGEALATADLDCDDTDAARNPAQTEIVGDEIDQDCDGAELCFADADDDGYRPDSKATVASSDTACTDPGEALGGEPIGDCDDSDAAQFPGGPEVVGDGRDGDCDGTEDCYADRDGDGATHPSDVITSSDEDCTDPTEASALSTPADCDDGDAARVPGGTEIVGDEVDGDCDGQEVCFADADGDGWTDATSRITSVDVDCRDASEARTESADPDCDDSDGSIHPGAADPPGDGIDQDCDGADSVSSSCATIASAPSTAGLLFLFGALGLVRRRG